MFAIGQSIIRKIFNTIGHTNGSLSKNKERWKCCCPANRKEAFNSMACEVF